MTCINLHNQEWWMECWRQVKRLAINTNCTGAMQPRQWQHSLSPLYRYLREGLASSLSAQTKRECFGTLAAGQQTTVSERGLGGTSQTLCGTSACVVVGDKSLDYTLDRFPVYSLRSGRTGNGRGASYPRQSPISFRPLPRACSKRRTRWRECSNSWMSAHTSACQPFSWAEDSPQVAQRV